MRMLLFAVSDGSAFGFSVIYSSAQIVRYANSTEKLYPNLVLCCCCAWFLALCTVQVVPEQLQTLLYIAAGIVRTTFRQLNLTIRVFDLSVGSQLWTTGSRAM